MGQGSSKHDHLVGYERSAARKLAGSPLENPFHVVLVEPEIPPNTGSIARTCAATGSKLHLVEPLGFQIDERAVRRAGLDYWEHVDVRVHKNFDAYVLSHPEARIHLLSANGQRSYLEADFKPGDALVFGRESVGLPLTILEKFPSLIWGIPALGPVRSLNLSNAVSIVLFEALRRSGAFDLVSLRDQPL